MSGSYQVMREDQQISPGDGPELKGRNSSAGICDLVNIPGDV